MSVRSKSLFTIKTGEKAPVQIRMAPIFDTGKAFGGSFVVPYTEEEIDNIEVNSFEGTEAALLSLVTDKTVVDLNKAITAERIRELYSMDSKMRPGQTDMTVRLYNKKTERLQNLQK